METPCRKAGQQSAKRAVNLVAREVKGKASVCSSTWLRIGILHKCYQSNVYLSARPLFFLLSHCNVYIRTMRMTKVRKANLQGVEKVEHGSSGWPDCGVDVEV